MSLLFPLYLAGLAAIGAPIVLHLIRRTPSGRTPFSSLMFLRTSPPRMVKRKSLDNLPLLCLRGLILILLALAFARPYLRRDAQVDADAGDERVALLVDTSASMRDLWTEALAEARAVIDGADAEARLSLATFDGALVHRVRPDEEEAPAGLRTATRAALELIEPGWGGSQLGPALTEVADELARSLDESGARASLVVVTDLQAGASLRGLEEYEWPSAVTLDFRAVGQRTDNASLHPTPRDRFAEDDDLFVRVANEPDSDVDRFELRWHAGEGDAVGDPVVVHCPPGETRVARAPERPSGDAVDRLVLSGDARPFDNALFDRAPLVRPLEVLSIGGSDADPRGLDFFLEHAVAGHPTRPTSLRRTAPDEPVAPDLATCPLVVVRLGPTHPPVEPLIAHARAGGAVLVVAGAPADEPDPSFLRALLDDPDLEISEGEIERGHALLGEVDFGHPLLGAFADARYRDFTKIRFWRRRHLETDARALIRFEDGAPFLVERAIGSGSVFALASSWTTADSDFARSTKFAPLVQALLRVGGAGLPDTVLVAGESVRVTTPAGASARVRKLGGDWTELPAGESVAIPTPEPGHYELDVGGRLERWTVRLDPQESRTAPVGPDVLDELLAKASTRAEAAAAAESTRQERVREMEERQGLWRFLVLAVVGGLLVETFWAGRLARRTETA